MESQPTTSDINKACVPIPVHGPVPRQSSSKPANPVFVTGHRDPPPSPARFLKKSEATVLGSHIPTGSSSSGSNPDFSAPFGHATSIDVLSITDATGTSGSDLHTVGLHFREGSGNARKAKAAVRTNSSDGSEEHLLSPHSYPPSQRATFSGQAANLRYHDSADHAPISAPTVFSRHAAPLSLPRLDKYISSLPIPEFSLSSRTKADAKQKKFMPLDRLEITGWSLESLETSYQRKPAWRNSKSILSGLVNFVLGVTVSPIWLLLPPTEHVPGVQCPCHFLQRERLVQHCSDICFDLDNDRYANQITAPLFLLIFLFPSSSSPSQWPKHIARLAASVLGDNVGVLDQR